MTQAMSETLNVAYGTIMFIFKSFVNDRGEALP